MGLLRNIAFAAASLIALEALFWAYRTLLRFIIDLMIHNLSGWVLLLIWILFGWLIYGFVRLIANILAMGYTFVCMIGTHQAFMLTWTAIMAIVAVVLQSIYIWSYYISYGFIGVFAAIFVTVNIIFLGTMIFMAVKTRLENEPS